MSIKRPSPEALNEVAKYCADLCTALEQGKTNELANEVRYLQRLWLVLYDASNCVDGVRCQVQNHVYSQKKAGIQDIEVSEESRKTTAETLANDLL